MRYETSIIIKQKSSKFAKNPCNYCGDGVVSTATDSSSKRYETCDTDSSGNIILPGNTSFNKSCTSITSTDASGTFIVPFSGIYEIKLDGANGGSGGDGYKAENGNTGSQTSGFSGSGGTRVTAQYYLTAGTTLSYTLGRNGSNGAGNKSTFQRKGGAGGAGGSGYQTGNSGNSGGNGKDPTFCKDSGGGGGGGGAGGSSAVMISGTVLMGAASGAGGAGGHGANNTSCISTQSGGSGGSGGASVGSNSYQSGSGTGWAYYTGWDTASTSGIGWIQITMKKYAPCNSCKLETNTSNFVNCN